ncbi:MAG: helix-turn-helix transcriptional regulator [Clostridia bacterium]|nr:helix-turn-helix transcriptional regulator [Clostridia bacterium]
MSFGSNLAEMRKQIGLSQEELGERLGVSRQTIYTWESDISSPNVEKLKNIAELFGCTVDALVRGEAKAESTAAEEKPRCKGNKEEISAFLQNFSLKIAFATALILIGIAAMILFGDDPATELLALGCLFVPLIVAVILYIYAGVSYSSFFEREENHGWKTLFTLEEKSAELRRYGLRLALAVGGILVGVLLLVLLMAGDPEALYPASLFMLILAASVFVIVYHSIPLSKYEKNGHVLSEDEEKKNPLAEALSAVLWMATTAVYLLLGFLGNWWHPGWIVFIVAAFLSGIIETLCNLKKN